MLLFVFKERNCQILDIFYLFIIMLEIACLDLFRTYHYEYLINHNNPIFRLLPTYFIFLSNWIIIYTISILLLISPKINFLPLITIALICPYRRCYLPRMDCFIAKYIYHIFMHVKIRVSFSERGYLCIFVIALLLYFNDVFLYGFLFVF